MKTRLNPYQAAPQGIEAIMGLENYVQSSGLELSLIELVKMRASQINGCAYCLHMHHKDALKAGESAERLFLLDAWHESLLFTPRERAALAWTDALTLVAQTHAPDADYDEAQKQFSKEELTNLTLLIGAINVWNRLSIGFRIIHPDEQKSVGNKAYSKDPLN